jgi:hypothetical protein
MENSLVVLHQYSCKSIDFLLTKNIKRDNQGIILLFKSNITAHGFFFLNVISGII